MNKPLEAQFYFGAVIDHDGECQRVSDAEAQFWTVYERNADGLSSAICDCAHRNDAVAATERFNALIAALEQSQQTTAYLSEQRDDWERKAISNFEECSEMSARIEELESQRKLAFTTSNRWADKCRDAEKRIAELEASQIAVKLPQIYSMLLRTNFHEDYTSTFSYKKEDVIEALRDAGITVQGDE